MGDDDKQEESETEPSAKLGEYSPDAGFFSSVFALAKLFFRPGQALEILFTPAWPRFLTTLVILTFFVPFFGNSLIDSTADKQSLFLFANRHIDISPAEFRKYYFLTASLALVAIVLIAALVQKLIVFFQRIDLSLIDSLAILTYSVFPFVFFLGIRFLLEIVSQGEVLERLGIPGDNPVTAALTPVKSGIEMILNAILACTVLLGLYIWIKAQQLLSELNLKRITANTILTITIPTFIVSAGLAAFLYFQSYYKADEPNLDHIRDSLDRRVFE